MIKGILQCYTSDWGRFSGRLKRSTFWLFYLSLIVGTIVLYKIERATGMRVLLPLTLKGSYSIQHHAHRYIDRTGLGWLSLTFILYSIIPNISAQCRRLHDSGRTGWWLLLGIIPLIGSIVVLIMLLLSGTKGPNEYGEPPH